MLFLDDDDCIECDSILEALEEIDDEADSFGIDFVKNGDPDTAKKFSVYKTPGERVSMLGWHFPYKVTGFRGLFRGGQVPCSFTALLS